MCVWTRELPPSCQPDSTSKHSDQSVFPFFSFLLPWPCLLFPAQHNEAGSSWLLWLQASVCMKCSHWLFGQQDRTEIRPRFKEELLSGTAGRGTQTPRSVSNPDPEVQREALDGGNNAALLRVVTQLLGLITAWKRLFHGGSGEKAGRLDVERAQQLAPEWAAIHESDWRIRMVFVTFDMPLASTVSAVNMVGNCWLLLSLCAFYYNFLALSLRLVAC